jgi:hypothetical protein
MSEVIDGFIPWKEVSKAYFRAREASAPAPAPAPAPVAPKAAVLFEEEVEEQEFDSEVEEDEEEDRPRMVVGEEEVVLDDVEGDADSVDTETELENKLSETVSLNI